ncbi:Hypothetical predicted protein [Mytilus galloprovincialis]|uniref:LRAT domain-containing protein n=1 Tax=Mytilus galloprovincialis TaxID=29158 RepID=A0A8B6FN43_MYTGA|nr:Hypothetical predicted protein [Mytilus galloprovincialis]
MGKSLKKKCKRIWIRQDYTLNQNDLQRSPSEETVKVLTKQQYIPSEKRGFTKITEDDEITEDPEIDDSCRIEHRQESHDNLDSRNNQNTKPVACIECVKPVQVFRSQEIKIGDHIKFHGKIYDHHAIVVNVKPSKEKDHKVVVELVHASNTTAGAIYCCLQPFSSIAKLLSETKQINLKKMKVMVYKYSNTVKHFSPERIAKRAVEKKSEPDFKYDALNYNCEHFATWCVTGESLSLQVRKIRLVRFLFANQGFQGIRDETLRNKIEYENEMLCKPCFERNKKLLSVAKQPIKSKRDVAIGDIITYTYYGCLHSAVVLEIEAHDKSLQCKIAHYAFRVLHRHRKIREESLRIPLDGSVKVTEYSKNGYSVYDPKEVVDRARSRLGETRYVYFSNDSSHYARWCKLKLYRK